MHACKGAHYASIIIIPKMCKLLCVQKNMFMPTYLINHAVIMYMHITQYKKAVHAM